MNSTIITKLKYIHLIIQNYSINNTFYLYNITKTLYDFRIYCLNQNNSKIQNIYI